MQRTVYNRIFRTIIFSKEGQINTVKNIFSRFVCLSKKGVIYHTDPRLPEPEVHVKGKIMQTLERSHIKQGDCVMIHTPEGILELCRVNKGPFDGYIGFVHDAKTHNDLYKAIEYTNRELEAIFAASHDGIVVADENGMFIRANNSYERITGLLKTDLLGRTADECMQEGILSTSVTLNVLKNGKSDTCCQTYRSGCESIISGSPILDDEGKIFRVVINVRDMTEVNKLKAELVKSQEKIDKYSRIVETLNEEQMFTENLVFRSPKMRAIRDSAIRFAKVDAPLLITGESGVGKEVITDLIYRNSLRKGAPFLKINCGAIPENLLESELFGYEGGAFTGAKKEGRTGLLEMANGGTLMLDEIGELSLNLQVKLLRVVEQQEFFPVGGKNLVKVDVRLLAATNRDLQEMVNQKLFRTDLFYRLNVLKLHIPPLRERPEDIFPITKHFLKKYNGKYHVKKRLSPELCQVFADYIWVGNVRELENLVERLVVICDREEITIDYLPEEMRKITHNVPAHNVPAHNDYEGQTYKQAKEKFEKEFLQRAVEKYRSSRRTAKHLGLDHSTIVRKAAQYGINLLPRWY